MTALVNSGFYGNGGVTSVGGSFNATGADYLRVWLWAQGAGTVTSVVFGGQTLTLVAGSGGGLGDWRGCYQLVAPSQSTQTVTATVSATSPRICVYISAWSGVNQSAPSGSPSTQFSDTQTTHTFSPTSNAGDVLEAVAMISGNSATLDTSNGAVQIQNQLDWVSVGLSLASAYDVTEDSPFTWTSAATQDGYLLALPIVAASGASYSLTADQGSYALTGQTANLRVARMLTAQQGSYTLLGQDAYVDISMNAAQGTYTFTGQAATLSKTSAGPVLTADSGSYALTGFAALRHLSMVASSGSYALTGQIANLLYGRKLIADYGSYQLLGRNSILLKNGVPDSGSAQQRFLMQRRFYGFRLSR